MTDFQNRAKFPIKSAKVTANWTVTRLLTDLPVSIQYWMQNHCGSGFGHRPAATGTVDWGTGHGRRIDDGDHDTGRGVRRYELGLKIELFRIIAYTFKSN